MTEEDLKDYLILDWPLDITWNKLEKYGCTAVHAYRDSKDTNKWYIQLLHPDKDRVHGMGYSYAAALQDALDKY
jgi:hypothetical protein